MFYNHADETERRKRRTVQLQARGLDVGHSFRSAVALGQGGSSASPKPVPGHAGRSSSSLRAVDTAVFSTYDNGATVSSSHNRPALWPPSHTEIVEGLHREGLLENETGANATNKIPAWYRGPLLLAGSSNVSASASALGLPLASSSSWSKSCRSGSETEGRGTDCSVRPRRVSSAPDDGHTKRRKKLSGLSGSTAASDEEKIELEARAPARDEELEDERDANDLPTAGVCDGYSEHEEEAIRNVITKLEDGSKETPYATYSNFTTENWIEHVCEPAIMELESNEAYMSTGMNPRKRFSCEAGVSNLRRWVSDQERRSMEASWSVERPAAAEAKAPEVPANPAGEGGEDMESHGAVGGTLGVSVSNSVMGFLSGRGFRAAGSASAGAGANCGSDAAGTIDSDAAPKVGQFGVNELGSWVGRRTSCLDDTARGSDARVPESSDNTPGVAEEDAARGLGRFGLGQFGPCVDMQSSNQDAGESGSSTTSTSMSDGDRSRTSAQWRNNIGYPVHDSMGLRLGSRGVPGEGRNVRDRRGCGNDRSMLGGSTTSGSTMSRFRSFGDGSTCSSSSWNSSWNSSQWEGSATSGKSNTYGFPSFPRENCPEGGLYGGVPRFNSSRNRIHSAIADGGGFTSGGGGRGRGRGRADNGGAVSPKPDIVWGVTGSKRLPASSSAVASGGKRDMAAGLRDSQPVHDGGRGGRVTRQELPPGEVKAPGVDRDREDLEVFGTGARRGGDKNGKGGTRGGGGGGGSGSGGGGGEADEAGGGNFISFGSGSNDGRRRGGRSDNRANGATPPRSRRRPPAVRECVGPHCAATPAAAAALEADILNQVPRPPRPFPPARRSFAAVGDGAHVKATPLAATTQSASSSAAAVSVVGTATASASSPPPRGSFTVGVENSKRWLLSRGAASERIEAGGSKKIGPRHLSCDPHIPHLTGNGATADSSPSGLGVVEATVSAATGTSMRGQEGERVDGGEGGMPVGVETALARAPRAVPLVARATHVAVLESDGRIGGIREMAVDGKFGEVSGTPGAAAVPTAFIWKGEGRQAPSPANRLLFAICDPGKRYRYLHLAVWLVAMGFMVADRLLWNVWPRQSFGGAWCQDGQCGEDFFCPVDEAAGCLMEGPRSVKAFDAVTRVSGRVIIATINLILMASCNGTWHLLSETECLRIFLRGWRADNDFLRTVGSWTAVVAVVAHVYVLLLPSVFDGFRNGPLAATGVSWPAQLVPGEGISRIDVDAETATWKPDDLVSVWLVTVILFLSALLLLVVRRRFFQWMTDCSVAIWWRLKAVAGVALVVESFRRRSHPHVWFLNGPIVLLYAIDHLVCSWLHRGEQSVTVTRVPLGTDYDLLLWFAPQSDDAGISVRPRTVQASIIGDVIKVHPIRGVTWGYWSPSSTAVFSSLCLPTVVQEAIDFAAAATNGTTSGDTGTLSTSARTAAFSQTNTVACARDRSAASGAAIAPERRQRGGDGGGGHSFNDEEQGVPVTWAFDDAKAADRDTRIATTKCHVQGTAGRGDFTNPPSSSGAGVREVTGGMVKRKSSRGHSLFQKGATVQGEAECSERKPQRSAATLHASAANLFGTAIEHNDQGHTVSIGFNRERLFADVGAGEERMVDPNESQRLGSPVSTIGSTSTMDRASLGISSPPSLLRGRRWSDRPVNSSGFDESLPGGSLSIEKADALRMAGNEIAVETLVESPPLDSDTEGFVQTESTVGSAMGDSVCSSFAGRGERREAPSSDSFNGQRRQGVEGLAPLGVSPLYDVVAGKGDIREFGRVFSGGTTGELSVSHPASVRSQNTAAGEAGGGGRGGGRGGRRGGASRFLQTRQGVSYPGQLGGLRRSGSTASSALSDSIRRPRHPAPDARDNDGSSHDIENPVSSPASALSAASSLQSWSQPAGATKSHSGGSRLAGEVYGDNTHPVEAGAKGRHQSSTISSGAHPKTRPRVPPAARPRSHRNAPRAPSFSGSAATKNVSFEDAKPVERSFRGSASNDDDANRHFVEMDWEGEGRDGKGEGEGEAEQGVVHNRTMWVGLEEGAKMVAVDAAADVDDIAVTMQIVVVPLERGEEQSWTTSGPVEQDEDATAEGGEGGDVRAGLRETAACMSGATYFSIIAAQGSSESSSATSEYHRPTSCTRGNVTVPMAADNAVGASPAGDVSNMTACLPPAMVSVGGVGTAIGERPPAVSTAGRGITTWNRMAIVRARVEKKKKITHSVANNGDTKLSRLSVTPTRTQTSEASVSVSEEGTLPEVSCGSSGGTTVRPNHMNTVSVNTKGPYRSALSGLTGFPDLPPLLVVGTGAGAGLVLEFLTYVSSTGKVPTSPITVCYASDNPPLLRFVTNELLVRKPSGVRVATELLSNAGGDDKKVDRGSSEGLMLGRLHLEGFIEKAPADTQVYFCGERHFDQAMRVACARMCLSYAGSCVR